MYLTNLPESLQEWSADIPVSLGSSASIADPGRSYIVYASNLKGNIGLKAIEQGRYQLRWLDCATGKTVIEKSVRVAAGDQSWAKPVGIGNEVALYMRKTDR